MQKVVIFNEKQNKVHIFEDCVDSREARKSEWEKIYLDGLRFKRRIEESEEILSKVFNKKHRMLVFNNRFVNN